MTVGILIFRKCFYKSSDTLFSSSSYFLLKGSYFRKILWNLSWKISLHNHITAINFTSLLNTLNFHVRHITCFSFLLCARYQNWHWKRRRQESRICCRTPPGSV